MNIVLFDTETTGLLLPDNTPLEDQPKIIEFYGVVIDEEFNVINELDLLINPGEPISTEITKITGITDDDVKDAPTFFEIHNDIMMLFHGTDLAVAHNISFDNGMLETEFKRIGLNRPKSNHDLCTVANHKRKTGYRISLGALYNKLFKSAFKAHRAKNDVQALVRIFHHLTENGEINLAIYKD